MDKLVSFDDDQLILVDKDDVELGYLSKDLCHLGEGKMHRAFSIFIANSDGKILLQKRSDQKMLWPDYWSNSCCSHPRKGETMIQAAHRRLEEELGLHSELKEIYKFEYRAQFKDVGVEYELCTVFVGSSDEVVSANSNEVSDWRWFSSSEIDELLAQPEEVVTPWFKMEWDALKREYPEALNART